MSLESSHWYSRDGKPCHTQPTKKGAKHPTRPTNVSDAKKLGLLPSVSAMTKMLSAPGLERHKLAEVAKACYRSPAHPGEDMKTYVNAMIEASTEDLGKAADLGTKIHAYLEKHYNCQEISAKEQNELVLIGGKETSMYDICEPVIAAVAKLNITIVASEKVLVNDLHGYAGTTDILFRTDNTVGVLDFKSKRTTPGEKVEPIDVHAMQIAAYIDAHWGITPRLPIEGYNVYISTTEIGRVEIVRYSQQELLGAFEDFKCLCHLWRSRNQYDPRVMP